MSCGRYLEGELNRQKVLDYLNEHPGSIAPEINKALGLKQDTGANILMRMTNNFKEVRRENRIIFIINSKGHRQSYSTFAYWALVKTTRTSYAVRKSLADNVNKPEFETPVKGWKDGKYTNNDPERRPIKCPDAMGSGGLKFGVQSSFSVI